jgi:hypothetical protein
LPELDDNNPNPSKKAKKGVRQGDDANSGFGLTSAGSGGINLAQNVVVFDEDEQDLEQAIEDDFANEVVDRSGVTDACSPRHFTVKTKTTPVASMKWTETAVVSDPSESSAGYNLAARVNWRPSEVNKEHDEFDFFNLAFPNDLWETIVALTNRGLTVGEQRVIAKEELSHISGIKLAIALESKLEGLPAYFNIEYSDGMDTVLPGGDFERILRKIFDAMSKSKAVFKIGRAPTSITTSTVSFIFLFALRPYLPFMTCYLSVTIIHYSYYFYDMLFVCHDYSLQDKFHEVRPLYSFFRTIIGVIITNSFLMYRYEQNSAPSADHDGNYDDFSTFMGKLAFQMIAKYNPTCAHRHSSISSSSSSSSSIVVVIVMRRLKLDPTSRVCWYPSTSVSKLKS